MLRLGTHEPYVDIYRQKKKVPIPFVYAPHYACDEQSIPPAHFLLRACALWNPQTVSEPVAGYRLDILLLASDAKVARGVMRTAQAANAFICQRKNSLRDAQSSAINLFDRMFNPLVLIGST